MNIRKLVGIGLVTTGALVVGCAGSSADDGTEGGSGAISARSSKDGGTEGGSTASKDAGTEGGSTATGGDQDAEAEAGCDSVSHDSSFDSSDPNVSCVDAWLHDDLSTNLAALNAWLADHCLAGQSPTLFVNGTDFEAARGQFISDEQITCAE